MITSYERAVQFLETLPHLEPGRQASRNTGSSTIDRARALLGRLGHPEKGPRYIHVGGTSGKGSTVALLHRMYHLAGYPVMSITSPHMTCTLERFAFRDGLIPEPIFIRAVERVRRAALHNHLHSAHGAPGYYDAVFATAMVAGRLMGADPIIIEVGVGGKHDSSNLIPAPKVAAITSVGLDHTHILGNSLADIAAEKAGIFKAGSVAVTGVQDAAVRAILENQARSVGIKLHLFGRDFTLSSDGEHWHYRDGKGNLGPLGLNSDALHRRHNAAVAIAIARLAHSRGLALPNKAIALALQDDFMPGRFELLPGTPNLILDVAHNPDKIAAFSEAFTRDYGHDQTLILGMARDKDLPTVLRTLKGRFANVVASRSMVAQRPIWRPREIMAMARGHFRNVVATIDPWDAIAQARKLTPPNGTIAITGSTFLVGDIRGIFQSERQIRQAGCLSPIADWQRRFQS